MYFRYESDCICVDGAGVSAREGPALRLTSKALLRNSARCYLYSGGNTPETPVSDSSVQVNNQWTYSCYTLSWFSHIPICYAAQLDYFPAMSYFLLKRRSGVHHETKYCMYCKTWLLGIRVKASVWLVTHLSQKERRGDWVHTKLHSRCVNISPTWCAKTFSHTVGLLGHSSVNKCRRSKPACSQCRAHLLWQNPGQYLVPI